MDVISDLGISADSSFEDLGFNFRLLRYKNYTLEQKPTIRHDGQIYYRDPEFLFPEALNTYVAFIPKAGTRSLPGEAFDKHNILWQMSENSGQDWKSLRVIKENQADAIRNKITFVAKGAVDSAWTNQSNATLTFTSRVQSGVDLTTGNPSFSSQNIVIQALLRPDAKSNLQFQPGADRTKEFLYGYCVSPFNIPVSVQIGAIASAQITLDFGRSRPCRFTLLEILPKHAIVNSSAIAIPTPIRGIVDYSR